MNNIIYRVFLFALAATVNASITQASWRDSSNGADLKNNTLEAKFYGGLLYELKDAAGKRLCLRNPLLNKGYS